MTPFGFRVSFRLGLAFIAPVLLASSLGARTLVVEDPSHLSLLSQASPGDIVSLKPGTWRDVSLRLDKAGTVTQPIVIRAAVPGRVVLTGSSTLVFNAPYVQVEGLLFKGGALDKGAVVLFASHNDLLSDCAVVDYNPERFKTGYRWVYFLGSDNRVDHCLFSGKNNLNPVIENGEPKCERNSVTRCLFKDIPLKAKANGREIVKVVGPGHVNADEPGGSYFTLEDNYFLHADGEGVEIVSLKSNGNRVLHNTIVASIGAINIRRGSHNEIRGNTVLGRGVPGAQGIRMSGSNNLIEGNYISGCDYGIAVSSGEYWDKPLTPSYVDNTRDGTAENKSRYPQNKGVTLRGNIGFNNTGPDIDIGKREYKKHWPENQNVLIPEACVIEGNLCVRPSGGDAVVVQVPDRTPPLDRFHFAANHYSNNTVLSGGAPAAVPVAGFEVKPLTADWSEDKALSALHPVSEQEVGPSWLRVSPR